MKKISLVLLSSLALGSAVHASSFNGFYLGGQLGVTQRSDKTSLASIDETLSGVRLQQATINKTKRSTGLTYGVYTGYGQTMNGFYLGAEISLEGDTGSKTNTQNPNITITPPGVSLPATLKTKYERGMVIGLSPRFGAVIEKDNLVYAKLGLEYSRDKLKASYNLKVNGVGTVIDQSYSKSKNQLVFVPGLGYERAFGKLLARIEYGYTIGRKINSSDRDLSVKYSAHTVKVGMACKF